ncbi:MAG: SnoaL-like domain [Panacagrimonas sp.]|jgi:hypothetical protein|nr:nuclear transport factor 2 family protein [Panacagrimonas sp.]MCC2659013.1 SnoaL-like domain [Panacagrimonas sp.]
MKDVVELSNGIVRAYNAKDFAKLRELMHPDLDFAHVNRGFAYRKREDLVQILELFANQLVPDRRMKEPERVLSQKDTVVRVAAWGGTAAADVPGFGKAGDAIEIVICSVMRFDDAGLLVEWKDYG